MRPVVRVGEEHLPHLAQGVPGAGGGEGDARGEVQQQRPVDQQRGRRAGRVAEGGRAHGARAVRAGQALGRPGAEQSQFHGPDPAVSAAGPHVPPV